MLTQSLRAARPSLARAMRPQGAVALRRTFITPTAVRQADQIQDMYLRELKNHKPTPVKAGDEKGHVLEFKLPKAPQSPEEANLQDGLKDYEAQIPEVEGQASGEGSAVEEDWFEEPEEEEEGGHH